jgi:TolB-like protein
MRALRQCCAKLAPLMIVVALVCPRALRADDGEAAGGIPRPRLALLDLSTDDATDKELGQVLGALVAERIARLDVFEVITQDDIRRLISFERMKTALTCEDDADCLAEIGGALGARYLITGAIGRLEKSFVVSLSFIDIETVETLGRETLSAPNALALSSQLDDVLTRLLSPVLVEWRGTLVIDSEDAGASVFVDDRAVGVIPLGPLALSAGTHRVSLSLDGYVSSLEEVTVPPKGKAHVTVALVPLAETYDALWRNAALLLVGGALAGTVGALVFFGGGLGGALFAESVKSAGKPTAAGLASTTLVSDTDATLIVAGRAVAAASVVVGLALLAGGGGLAMLAEFPDEPPAQTAGGATP